MSDVLARRVAKAVDRLRSMEVAKKPGVAETIDWAAALQFLGLEVLGPREAEATLGAVIKDHEDQQLVRSRIDEVVGEEEGHRRSG